MGNAGLIATTKATTKSTNVEFGPFRIISCRSCGCFSSDPKLGVFAPWREKNPNPPICEISQPEQIHDFLLVEADHRLAVDDGHRRALKTLVEQLLERRLVGADIFFDERDALLR